MRQLNWVGLGPKGVCVSWKSSGKYRAGAAGAGTEGESPLSWGVARKADAPA